MRALIVALLAPVLLGSARTHPQPVSSIGGLWNSNGTITINWTLPADPSVTGIRIFRERLDRFDELIFDIGGLTTSYTDTSAHFEASYRYWVQTKSASGQLSDAVYIEFLDDDDESHLSCWASAANGPAPAWPFLLAGALGLAFLRRR